MPPKAKVAVEAPTEEWEAGASTFFGDFDTGDGPSKRKYARDLAKREARTGKTLEEEAMDPTVSAAEARRKIANIVRARAGVAPQIAPRHHATAGSTVDADALPLHVSKKEKIEAKFERKEQRKQDQKLNAKKNRKVLKKVAAQNRFRK